MPAFAGAARAQPKAGSLVRPEDERAFDAFALRDLLRFSGGKKVIEFFREMDGDGSGEVTKKEFRRAVAAMGYLHATNEQADSAFDALDTDHSGKLDYLELDKRLRRLGDRPEAALPPATAEGEAGAEAEAVVEEGAIAVIKDEA